MTDKEIDIMFDKFLDQPELSSWVSDLSGPEHEDAKRLFRELVRKIIAKAQSAAAAIVMEAVKREITRLERSYGI